MSCVIRGVDKLTLEEKRALACIVNASNNKKVLPTEGMNINSLNIREAVFSAAASFDMPVDKATLSASSGLSLAVQRGASEEQLLHHGRLLSTFSCSFCFCNFTPPNVTHSGFREADLLGLGCSRPDVISSSKHNLAQLHDAGVATRELLEPEATGLLTAPKQLEQLLGGQRGASSLRDAGYSAREILQAQVHTPWDLKQAGYSDKELAEAGVLQEDLLAAGCAEPQAQPPSFLAGTFRSVCSIHPASLSAHGKAGLSTREWRTVLQPAGK